MSIVMQLLQGLYYMTARLYYMTASLHLQYSSTLKMEAAHSSQTPMNIHQIIQHHIPKPVFLMLLSKHPWKHEQSYARLFCSVNLNELERNDP